MRARETVKKLEAVKTYGTIKQCGRRRQYRLAFALAAALGIVCCGTAAAASQPVFCPQAVAAGPDGSLVVTDCYSKVIWKVTGDERTVYAGKPGQEGLYGEPLGGYGDGTRSGMRMEEPWDIVPYGEGYAVSDRENHMVRYIDAQGSRTLAGRGREGYEDNRGGRALFSGPTGLAADDAGNLYIADTGNDVIRRLRPDGMVDTYLRGLSGPVGLCWHEGALYVSDTGNHRVLKVENGEIVWTAGGAEGQADGGFGLARFSSPTYLAVSEQGTLYVSDTGNAAVRKLENGTVATVSWDQERYPGMELVSPSGLMAADGALYVCDRFNRQIYILSP